MASGPISDTTGSAPRPRRWITRRRLGCLLLVGLPVAYVTDQCLVRPLLNPLRRSPESITADLLERMPPGSPRAEVEAWVDAQRWRHGGRPYPLAEVPPLQRVVGEYESFTFIVVVSAEWRFGPDGRLETVEVHKWIANAP
jgi:hypothetical protein